MAFRRTTREWMSAAAWIFPYNAEEAAVALL
jgi:hypothetical protein